jgi:hypothetical protein
MKLTIISIDKAVYVNGISYNNLNLTNIPLNIHALQWIESQGHIEFNDGTPNQEIFELPIWANDAYDIWNKKDLETKEKESLINQEPTIASLTKSQKLDIIRIERDKRLLACDWTQLPDAPSNINKALWANYRQELRDLPSLSNLDLDNPSYPIPPSD